MVYLYLENQITAAVIVIVICYNLYILWLNVISCSNAAREPEKTDSLFYFNANTSRLRITFLLFYIVLISTHHATRLHFIILLQKGYAAALHFWKNFIKYCINIIIIEHYIIEIEIAFFLIPYFKSCSRYCCCGSIFFSIIDLNRLL